MSSIPRERNRRRQELLIRVRITSWMSALFLAVVGSMAAVATVALCAFAFTAKAQEALQDYEVKDEPPRGVTVTERRRPELDPLGVRAAGFLFYPKLGVTEQYDDNIFSTETGEEDDFITIVSPSFWLRSDWRNHALNFFGTADIGLHAENDAEDYEDYTVGTEGRVDIVRRSFVTAGFRFAHLHEARGSPDDVAGDKPTEFNVLFPQVGVTHRFGRFVVNVDGTLRRFDFDDVPCSSPFVSPCLPAGVINNDDRDRNQWKATVRLDYEIVPNYEAFIRGSYLVTEYDDAVDDNDFDRDSGGYEVVVGTAIDFTGVTFGDVFVGFRSQDPDDPALPTIDGVTFGGQINWNVTGLTTARGFVRRRVEETTQSGSSGSFVTRVGASVDHELLRNLLVGARASYTNYDYEGIDRDDDEFRAGVYGKYLLNRNLYLSARYEFRDRESTGADAGRGFDKNVFMVRLETQL